MIAKVDALKANIYEISKTLSVIAKRTRYVMASFYVTPGGKGPPPHPKGGLYD